MDYTKVISTVKKYAFAIADKLRQVSNDIIGELESFYQAIKQETDAIKTGMAGVKTDVAGVKTDVAEVKSAITAANQLADQINGEVI